MAHKHVVLGGNGVTGRETIAALLAMGHSVTSVARTPAVAEGADSAVADLTDPAATVRVLKGAAAAYLTVGLPYSATVWQRDWPVIMANTIEACLTHGTRLVYLDNVYAYGRVDAPMTEATPLRPVSRKGQVRAALIPLLEAAAGRGLDYTVARSADFYGPGAATSAFNRFAVDRIVAGKPPQWLFDATQPHSMTYTPDIGAALAVLGTADQVGSRTWHIPTAPALTGAQYLTLAAGHVPRRPALSRLAMLAAAPFLAEARESLEMAYQYTAPYHFDSTAFERAFDLAPTAYELGIARTLAAARAARQPSAG